MRHTTILYYLHNFYPVQQQLCLKSFIKCNNSSFATLNVKQSTSSRYYYSHYVILITLHLQPTSAAAVGRVWPPVSGKTTLLTQKCWSKRGMETPPLTPLPTSSLPSIPALTYDTRMHRIAAQRLRPGGLQCDLLNFWHPSGQKVKQFVPLE